MAQRYRLIIIFWDVQACGVGMGKDLYRPFFFRPLPNADIEWADNWFSNVLAWAATQIFPRWCMMPDHWSVKVTELLWTDCPCCLGLRFMTLGLCAGFIFGFIFGALVW